MYYLLTCKHPEAIAEYLLDREPVQDMLLEDDWVVKMLREHFTAFTEYHDTDLYEDTLLTEMLIGETEKPVLTAEVSDLPQRIIMVRGWCFIFPCIFVTTLENPTP